MNQAMQVFLGSMFGDGSLYPYKGGRIGYTEMHSLKQKDYLIWKMKIMSKRFNFANSPYIFNKYDKRTKKIYPSIKIDSSEWRKLKKYYQIFYKDGRKVIPIRLLYKLNKLGLAIWYQDDGYYGYGKYTSVFSTDAFNYKEVLIIMKFFKNKFGIESRLVRKGDAYNFEFDRDNTEKFLKLIRDYIHPIMTYKLGHLDKNNKSRIIRAKKVISKNKHLYYLNNKEKIINYQKKYRKENKEKISVRSRLYNIKNKDKIKERRRRYYNLNREMILKRNRIYRLENKNTINERRRLKNG